MELAEIITLAQTAAESAVDVSGCLGHVPSADDAYEFMLQLADLEESDEAAQAKWDSMQLSPAGMDLFRAAYIWYVWQLQKSNVGPEVTC